MRNGIVKNNAKNGFYPLPVDFLYRQTITKVRLKIGRAAAELLYVIYDMLCHYNAHSGTYLTAKQLSNESCLSLSTVFRAVAILKAKKLITVSRKKAHYNCPNFIKIDYESVNAMCDFLAEKPRGVRGSICQNDKTITIPDQEILIFNNSSTTELSTCIEAEDKNTVVSLFTNKKEEEGVLSLSDNRQILCTLFSKMALKAEDMGAQIAYPQKSETASCMAYEKRERTEMSVISTADTPTAGNITTTRGVNDTTPQLAPSANDRLVKAPTMPLRIKNRNAGQNRRIKNDFNYKSSPPSPENQKIIQNKLSEIEPDQFSSVLQSDVKAFLSIDYNATILCAVQNKYPERNLVHELFMHIQKGGRYTLWGAISLMRQGRWQQPKCGEKMKDKDVDVKSLQKNPLCKQITEKFKLVGLSEDRWIKSLGHYPLDAILPYARRVASADCPPGLSRENILNWVARELYRAI